VEEPVAQPTFHSSLRSPFLTEVFVCFQDTIHIALNLRKAAIDRKHRIPLQRELKAQEPFFYRNRGPHRQYAYRLIDGLYCNNLYPISRDLSYDVLIHDRINRLSPCPTIAPGRPPSHWCDTNSRSGVKLLTASTRPRFCLPFSQSEHALNSDSRIVLIEGYSSGTFQLLPVMIPSTNS
jgi:hypothetical protein